MHRYLGSGLDSLHEAALDFSFRGFPTQQGCVIGGVQWGRGVHGKYRFDVEIFRSCSTQFCDTLFGLSGQPDVVH